MPFMRDKKGRRLDSIVIPSSDEVGRASAAYRFLIPGQQSAGSGSARDKIGNGADATIPAATYTDPAVWANRGYLTTTAGTGKGLCVSHTKSQFDLATTSVILAFVVNAPTPAASIVVLGNGDLSTTNGFYLSGRTSGKIRPIFRTSAGSFSGLLDSTFPVLDGTDHTVVLAFDALTKSAHLWVDGVLSDTWTNAFTGNTAGGTTSLNIGAWATTAQSLRDQTTYGLKLNSLHMLTFTGGLPINVGQLAQMITDRPTRALRDVDIFTAEKRVLLVAAPGQSNELGSGVWLDQTPGFGFPLRDPVAPNGQGLRSMWPHLSEKLGQRGVSADVINAAVGSTSAAKSWCGQVLTWTSGLLAGRGTYVLTGGGLWMSQVTAGTFPASTVAPTGTADVTGADSVPWKYMGAPLSYEVPGYVLKDGDAHFDPNGYFATAYAAAQARTGTYDEKWALISIGQTDKTVGTVRADYKQALINATNYWRTRGFRVAIGFTCYADTAGSEAWYQSNLLPGWADAVASFAGNPNVIAGANLRTALGVLPAAPFDGVPGLKTDQLHMNDPALALASEAVAAAFVTAGWA